MNAVHIGIFSAGQQLIVPLVTARAPGLLTLYGIGPNTAVLLLIGCGTVISTLDVQRLVIPMQTQFGKIEIQSNVAVINSAELYGRLRAASGAASRLAWLSQ